MENYFETDLDVLNRFFRYKIIRVITNPTMLGSIDHNMVGQFSVGLFLEANVSGIWIYSLAKDRRWKKDFYYHDKIIKIEELDQAKEEEVPEKENETIKQMDKKRKQSRDFEIKQETENNPFAENDKIPDAPDPSDKSKVIDMLTKVQNMVLEKKKIKEDENLDLRV